MKRVKIMTDKTDKTDKTIEFKAAETVLQDKRIIDVKGRKYEVAPPTTATIIEASKYIAGLPVFTVDKEGNMVMEALASAKDCECFGDVAAILMLGKKNLTTEKRYLGGIFRRRMDNKAALAKELMETLSPQEMNDLIVELIKLQRVDFFLGITFFLNDVNLLRRSKTTASGQS
jgi:hypothetical protein